MFIQTLKCFFIIIFIIIISLGGIVIYVTNVCRINNVIT